MMLSKPQLFAWMKSQNDILDDSFGNITIITATGFKLDQNRPPRKTYVAKEHQNILKPEDYYVIEHWEKKVNDNCYVHDEVISESDQY